MPVLSTHSGRLERWLGKEACETVSKAMVPWYGRPIGLAGVPGNVRVYPGGDIRGRVLTGAEASVQQQWEDVKARARRALHQVGDPARLNAAFASLSDLVAAFSTPSKRRSFPFAKTGAAGTTAATSSLWQSAGWPPAGAAGSAAPGGRVCDSSTVGAFPLLNAAGGQTLKWLSAYVNASVINGTLLLYDRLYDVAKTMSSAVAENVTGVPTRYTSTVTTNDDYIQDNFLAIETQATLGATAHNWTGTYTNQAGTAGQVIPSLVGNASNAAQRLDQPTNGFFVPLATGDTGIKALTQMTCSAVVTGSINFFIGHPIAWIPCAATASVMAFTDGVSSAFARIFDNACLAFLEVVRPTSTACNYSGTMFAVSS